MSEQINCKVLEYIESTGTQYIDTNYVSNNNSKIVTEIYGAYSNVSWYGGRKYVDSSNSCGIFNFNGRFDWTGTSGTGKSIVVNPSIDTWHKISHGKELYVDEQLKITYEDMTSTSKSPICIFANRTEWVDNTIEILSYSSIKIKYFKIYDGDTLVHDFVPVKTEEDEICLYDKVTKKLFHNQGTGTFLAGAETGEIIPISIVFIQPVYDRTLQDVQDVENKINNPKGMLSHTMLNRIEHNCEFLAHKLSSYGYATNIVTKTDWSREDFPYDDEMARIVSNINAIRDSFNCYSTTPYKIPIFDVQYTTANDMEKIIYDINELLNKLIEIFLYSGEIYSGEVNNK